MGDTFPNCVNTKKDGIEHKVGKKNAISSGGNLWG